MQNFEWLASEQVFGIIDVWTLPMGDAVTATSVAVDDIATVLIDDCDATLLRVQLTRFGCDRAVCARWHHAPVV